MDYLKRQLYMDVRDDLLTKGSDFLCCMLKNKLTELTRSYPQHEEFKIAFSEFDRLFDPNDPYILILSADSDRNPNISLKDAAWWPRNAVEARIKIIDYILSQQL